MKALSLFLVALLATVTLCRFTPVANYNLSLLQGTWNVQSIYDTVGNDWSLAYCFQLNFNVINQSVVNMTSTFYDGYNDALRNDTLTLYPNATNPSTLYQDVSRQQAPLVVLNTSSLPYWVNNGSNVTIFAFNYTTDRSNPQYIVFGASRWYDTEYDITPFLQNNSLPVNNTKNFWFVNTACDTHFGWNPLSGFHESSLEGTWNLVGVYDPAGTNLIPWYTEGGIYDWDQAYCAQVSFAPTGTKAGQVMNMTAKSLYQGSFQRSWRILPAPELNSVLLGFNINANTLLYVQYADFAGNLVLTAGTTTSFFLTNTASTLTPINRGIFEVTLRTMGPRVDISLIRAIDNTNC